jgi:UDP-N-acetylmuramoylalanine--D-glutamate ligase
MERSMVQPGQKVLVLGLGESGFAAARLARRCGAEVTVLDSGASKVLEDRASTLGSSGVDAIIGWLPAQPPPTPELAVISPGIPPASALGRLAGGLSCPVISELELGYRHCACPILAVTGSNGKTTTVELLGHTLRQAGVRVATAGNIGLPLCEAALGSSALDLMVVEVSSFQLEQVEHFAPLTAAILNITPDHLDRHGDMASYRATKLRILRHLASPADAVLRADLAAGPEVRAVLRGTPTTFAGSDDGTSTWFVSARGDLCRRLAVAGEVRVVLAAEGIGLPGRHNAENVLATLALAERAGVAPERLAPHLASFSLGPHRLETVAVHDGVRFINDSKATNPDAPTCCSWQEVWTRMRTSAAWSSPSRRTYVVFFLSEPAGSDWRNSGVTWYLVGCTHPWTQPSTLRRTKRFRET